MLKVKNISKEFEEIKAVDNISFEVKNGEIVGLLGPNGAGKTTTMRLITGFLNPNKGTITIDELPPKQAQHLIGYLPEENPLYSQLAPIEYLQFIARMKKPEQTNHHLEIKEVIEKCGLKEVLSQTIETLSRGYRQRVGLAATLIHDPRLLVMDEPTTGLDPNQQKDIRSMIKKIAENKAVIFSTHILAEAEAICQRILIIHQGRLVAQENLSSLKEKKKSLEEIFTEVTK